jgi:hypothetical protein
MTCHFADTTGVQRVAEVFSVEIRRSDLCIEARN